MLCFENVFDGKLETLCLKGNSRLHGQGMKEGISEICICGGENKELRLPMKRQILEEGLGSFVPQCCWSASLLVTDAI